MTYTHHEVKHTLADGTPVLWNRVQGYSIDSVADQCLRPLTKLEMAEVEQIAADDAADRNDDMGKEAGR